MKEDIKTYNDKQTTPDRGIDFEFRVSSLGTR